MLNGLAAVKRYHDLQSTTAIGLDRIVGRYSDHNMHRIRDQVVKDIVNIPHEYAEHGQLNESGAFSQALHYLTTRA